MRKTICILVAGILIMAGSAWSANVTDVELSFGDGFTRARLAVDGEVEYSHQTVEASDGKPFRVILDLKGAVHDLPGKSYTDLPSCPVTSIRTSQFTANPVPIVRLVFDMRRPSIYRVDTEKGYLTVFFADNAGKEFPVWTATGNPLPKPVSNPTGSPQEKYFAFVGEDKAKPAPTPSSTSADKPSKPAKKLNQAIQEDRLASLKANTPESGYGPSVDMTTVPVTKKEKPVTTSKPVAAKSKELSKPTVQPVNMPEAQPSLKPLVTGEPVKAKQSDTPEVKRVPGFKPYASHPTEIVDKPLVAKEQKPEPRLTAARPAIENKTMPNPPQAKQPVPDKPKAKTSPTVANKPLAQESTPKPVVKPGEFFGPQVDMSLVPRTAKPQPKLANENQTTSSKMIASADQPKPDKPVAAKTSAEEPTVKPGEAAEKADEGTVDRKNRRTTSTSRFRRNPVMSRKMKGTMVAEFPKRLVVKYQSQTRRDPFETLINEQRTHNNPVEQRVANVDGLRLVGVIEAEDGANRALFEDQEGYGYILKSGDKVRNGYVLRVESNRVYFQIFEYGWSRTVALKIDEY